MKHCCTTMLLVQISARDFAHVDVGIGLFYLIINKKNWISLAVKSKHL